MGKQETGSQQRTIRRMTKMKSNENMEGDQKNTNRPNKCKGIIVQTELLCIIEGNTFSLDNNILILSLN